MSQPSAPSIYPDLPKDVDGFRLQKIDGVRKEIQRERSNREQTYKKYKKVITALSYTETLAEVVGIAAGSTGIVAIAGGITAPLGLAFEGVAIGCGAATLIVKYFNSKLKVKARKHDSIRVLADSKLNSIDDIVSQALEDGSVEQEEFQCILSEQNKFFKMKDNFRAKKSVDIQDQNPNETEKKELIQKLLNLK